MQEQLLYEQRSLRLQRSIGLQEPDRVPFMPSLNNYYVYAYIMHAMTHIGRQIAGAARTACTIRQRSAWKGMLA